MRARPLLLLATVLLVACGSGGGSTATPSTSTSTASASTATATPGYHGPALFAIVSLTPGGGSPPFPMTVLIVDATGKTVAHATAHQASGKTQVGNAATIQQPPASAARGEVVFSDEKGALSTLAVDGTVTPLVTFPIGADQEELAFAASPDATRVVASTRTLPNWVPCTDCPGGGQLDQNGSMHVKVDTWSKGGGAPVTGYTADLSGQAMYQAPQVIGWDAGGAVMATDESIGSQAQRPGIDAPFGHAVHLDSSGHPGAMIGGSDCVYYNSDDAGDVLCATGSSNGGYSNDTQVRTASGAPLWSPPAPSSPDYVAAARLSPDGTAVAMTIQAAGTTTVVVRKDGSKVSLPADTLVLGWAGNDSVVVAKVATSGPTSCNQRLEVVPLAHPSSPVTTTTCADDLYWAGLVEPAS